MIDPHNRILYCSEKVNNDNIFELNFEFKLRVTSWELILRAQLLVFPQPNEYYSVFQISLFNQIHILEGLIRIDEGERGHKSQIWQSILCPTLQTNYSHIHLRIVLFSLMIYVLQHSYNYLFSNAISNNRNMDGLLFFRKCICFLVSEIMFLITTMQSFFYILVGSFHLPHIIGWLILPGMIIEHQVQTLSF